MVGNNFEDYDKIIKYITLLEKNKIYGYIFNINYDLIYHGLCKQIFFNIENCKKINKISKKIISRGGLNALITCYYIICLCVTKKHQKYYSNKMLKCFDNELFCKLIKRIEIIEKNLL